MTYGKHWMGRQSGENPVSQRLGAATNPAPEGVFRTRGRIRPRGGGHLANLLDRFDATASVKEGTRTTYLQSLAMLRRHFGETIAIDSMTPAHADEWRKAIGQPDKAGKRLATATVAKRVKDAKAVFREAVRWQMIPANPFADLRAGCPDEQWRAIVSLSRFAGLRCPSEIVAPRWGDMNWERGRLMVRSVKTEGHEGHAVRVVPIVPELRPILQDLFDAAEPGTEADVPRLRDPKVNLRTQLERIIAKACVKPWPRQFHNMRASCATDWVERFPAHVVAGWLGHSPIIAAQHYLQTRHAHFDLAADVGGAVCAAANPATHKRPQAPALDQRKKQKPHYTAELVGVSVAYDPVTVFVQIEPMTPAGFEPASLP